MVELALRICSGIFLVLFAAFMVWVEWDERREWLKEVERWRRFQEQLEAESQQDGLC